MKRDETGSSQDLGTVLKFRRKPSGARYNRVGESRKRDIIQLLDLSKYENPNNAADDFKRRMIENIAAVLVLGALVGIGAVDVVSLEQIQHCASVQDCSH